MYPIKANMRGRIRSVLKYLKTSDDSRIISLRPSQLQCPATVSVIGAFASQEAIKACSNMHTPLSQVFVFESLDSLLSTENQEEKVCHSNSTKKILNCIKN